MYRMVVQRSAARAGRQVASHRAEQALGRAVQTCIICTASTRKMLHRTRRISQTSTSPLASGNELLALVLVTGCLSRRREQHKIEDSL